MRVKSHISLPDTELSVLEKKTKGDALEGDGRGKWPRTWVTRVTKTTGACVLTGGRSVTRCRSIARASYPGSFGLPYSLDARIFFFSSSIREKNCDCRCFDGFSILASPQPGGVEIVADCWLGDVGNAVPIAPRLLSAASDTRQWMLDWAAIVP